MRNLSNKILCVTCNKCKGGERIDECVDVFDCTQYDLKVFGVESCNHYESEEDQVLYEIGEPVLYQNGSRFELGIVKSFNSQGKPFVLYHTGDTAACTPLMHLHKIANNYAFIVERLNCNAPMNEIIDRKEKVLNINLRK